MRRFGELWKVLGRLLEALGGLLEPFGDHMGALEGSQTVIRVILEAAGRILGPLGALLEPLGEVLGASWEYFEGMLGLFVDDFVAWKAVLKRFAEILKNL